MCTTDGLLRRLLDSRNLEALNASCTRAKRQLHQENIILVGGLWVATETNSIACQMKCTQSRAEHTHGTTTAEEVQKNTENEFSRSAIFIHNLLFSCISTVKLEYLVHIVAGRSGYAELCAAIPCVGIASVVSSSDSVSHRSRVQRPMDETLCE